MGDSMSGFVVAGDSSGAITLVAPDTAGTNTITLPASTGTVALTSDTIGIGQTWQNVGASRSTGTIYTNSTGRTIMVAITGLITSSVAFSDWFEVGGTVVSRVGGVGSTANMPAYVYAIVPPGLTYRLNTVSGVAFNYWSELR